MFIIGKAFPIPCPLGYIGSVVPNNTHDVLASMDTACTPCLPGYYGTDPLRLECTIGLAGYYYTGASTSATPTNITSQHGDICPKGYYCPTGILINY